jgi:glucosamine--fructose-6-phosphate aminotransferase (isomerizing)
VEKHVGKIGNLKLNSTFSSLPSHLSIGHTRWATHGGVTAANAHPHLDCTEQIAIVHNGIVENFNELKTDLLKKGHTFKSETDTEVIAHLIEEELKKKGFATAVRDAFNQLNGMNAIVVAYAPSKEIITAKTGSPLAIGIGNGEYFVASDASGIVEHTKNVVFLADHQMAILGDNFKLLRLPDGREIKPEITKLTWKFENEVKGKYPHFLLKEINEEPQVIQHIALHYDEPTKKLAEMIDKAFGTFILGCGTASYAALAGTYLFSSVAKKHVNFSIGSEFKYLEDYVTPKTLIIPISQSGETIDVVDPIEKVKTKGAKVAAIVNVLGSTLYRQADFSVLLEAGQEKAVVGTKSMFAMLSVLILTAFTLAKRQSEAKKLLLAAAKNVQDILKETKTKPIK